MAFKKSTKLYDEESLYEYAVRALGRHMRTVAELKRLMRQRRLEGDSAEKERIIDAVVQRLKDQRYLNDTQYASMYSSIRKEDDKLGQQRVISDLRSKGVHPDVIGKTVSVTYEGVDEESLAREFLKRKRLAKPSVAKRGDQDSYKKSQKETARIFRMLIHAGFRTGTILKILKNWDVDDEVLTALEEETEAPSE